MFQVSTSRPYLCYINAMNILVIEDEKKIASLMKAGLKEQGMNVDLCRDGDSGLERALTFPYDVLVLDIMLPGRDGLSILRQLREAGKDVPVILVTARSALPERLEGLNLGADDYLTKPFYIEELIARIHALRRRVGEDRSSLYLQQGVRVNLLTREVHRDERCVDLTNREFLLLEYLIRQPGRVYTRTQILEHVWGYDFDPQTNLVDVYIQRLRKKLCEEGETNPIETVRGVGYRFLKEGSSA